MFLTALSALCIISITSSQDWVVYEGEKGPGVGKHIVFLAGDEEYRSEEGLPQMAKILAYRHGFKCTVLFSLDEDGVIDPDEHFNQPGLEVLKDADLCVFLLRFREWPDDQMRHFVNFYLAGKPMIALRTSTHAFDLKDGAYSRFGGRSQEWRGGFGKQVLGEKWVSHWGNHGSQATRGINVAEHVVLNGVKDVFGTTDVYEAAPPADATVLMLGEVVEGMNAGDPTASNLKKTAKGVEQKVNDPMMPIVWLRSYENEAGYTNQIMTTTMGAATDLLNEGLRRLIVNTSYWLLGMDVPKSANAKIVGDYQPSPFGFGNFKKGVKPADH